MARRKRENQRGISESQWRSGVMAWRSVMAAWRINISHRGKRVRAGVMKRKQKGDNRQQSKEVIVAKAKMAIASAKNNVNRRNRRK
jgi:hypothetical protein